MRRPCETEKMIKWLCVSSGLLTTDRLKSSVFASSAIAAMNAMSNSGKYDPLNDRLHCSRKVDTNVGQNQGHK